MTSDSSFFTRDGLDIRDEKGQSLGASGDRPVSIPLANLILLLQSHPLEKQFTHLWERETGLNASQILFGLGGQYLPVQCGNQKVYPENFFTDGRSRPWKAWEYTKKKISQKLATILPIEPGDAIWLINRFMEEEYPRGGNPRLCKPSTIPWGGLCLDQAGVISQEAVVPSSSPEVVYDRVDRDSQ